MQKISHCLWFDDNAEEAVNLYTSIFKNSKVGKTTRYDMESAKASGRPEGSVLTIEFQLENQEYLALNGGPMFKHTEAFSIIVNCDDQEEVDYYWNALTADGGEESMCGWLKDKFGISWQITPVILTELISGQDTEKSKRVMQAMLQMKKIDFQKIKDAASSN
jgi:predicted 3-demethylubiquinone-9 3-methyltransferase (glyoxalase superfamily)